MTSKVIARPGVIDASVASAGDAQGAPRGYRGRVAADAETLEVAGRDIRVTNPGKVYFPDASGGPITKLYLVLYWV
jgi:hypothetical protein